MFSRYTRPYRGIGKCWLGISSLHPLGTTTTTFLTKNHSQTLLARSSPNPCRDSIGRKLDLAHSQFQRNGRRFEISSTPLSLSLFEFPNSNSKGRIIEDFQIRTKFPKKKKEEKKSQLSIYLKLPFRLIGRLHAKSGRDFCLFLFSNCRRVSKRWRCRSVEGKEKKSGGRGGGRSAQLHRGAKDRGTWTIESGNSRPRGRHFLLCRPFLRRMSCRVYLCDGRN